jgi:hypothetical protein
LTVNWNPFRKKVMRVSLSEPTSDLSREYDVYKVKKLEPNHVILTTSAKKKVDIQTIHPMDIIVEDL